MDRLAALIASRKSTDSTLAVGKDVYAQITASFPPGLLDNGGRLVYKGLLVKLDESKEAGYAELQ
jgi:hypothetical protein